MEKIPHYNVSLTNANVPNDDAINSNTLSLSFFCTFSSISSSPLSSEFSIKTSPCIRVKTFR